MSELELKLRLEGIDANEAALYNLQRWLKDAGIFAEVEIPPPAEGDMGGKPATLLLAFILTVGQLEVPPQIAETLQQIHRWQLQHQTIQPILELSSQHPRQEEEIEKKIRREEWHIHVERRRRRWGESDYQPEATNK